MIFSSGIPEKLTVDTASDYILSVEDDIARMNVLLDELKSYQEAKATTSDELKAYQEARVTIADAAAAKAEVDAYVAQTKAEIDSLKSSTTEKLNKAKKREAEANELTIALQADRAAIQAEKDAAEKEIGKMWDTLKADIVKLDSDQSDMLAKQSKYEQDRAELDARITKLQATVALMTQ